MSEWVGLAKHGWVFESVHAYLCRTPAIPSQVNTATDCRGGGLAGWRVTVAMAVPKHYIVVSLRNHIRPSPFFFPLVFFCPLHLSYSLYMGLDVLLLPYLLRESVLVPPRSEQKHYVTLF